MTRSVKETPILYGDDAECFDERMKYNETHKTTEIEKERIRKAYEYVNPVMIRQFTTMQPKHLNLQVLPEQVDLHSFSRGDEDLNGFLINNAYQSMMHRMSLTYILEENEQVVAYFSLLFDRTSKEGTRNTTSFIGFRSNKGFIMESRDFKSYPSLKVGRLGVNISYQKRQSGHLILGYIKRLALIQQLAGCRFITVDAYRTTFTFYERNGFEYLTLKDVSDHTGLIYYDLYRLL